MATVTTSPATKRHTKPQAIPGKRGRPAKNAAETLPGEEPLKQMAKPTELIWVHALTDAGGFHRDALQLELAVGLSLFASTLDGKKVDLQSKKALRAVYEKAGYACKTQAGEDYKTVARRINVAADLYTFLGGRETIVDWVEDATAKQQVGRIMERLKSYNFDGINSVLTYVGKPVTAKRIGKMPPATPMTEAEKTLAQQLDHQVQERRDAEAKGIPPGRIIVHGHMQAVIPFDATYDDVMAVALELMTFAKLQMQLPVAVVQ